MSMLERFSGRRSEAGDTLIEVLISAVLVGLVVVALIGGLASTVFGAHVHRDQADANSILVSAMERIKASAFSYSNVDCTQTPAARRAAYENKAREVTLPPNWSSSSLTVAAIKFESTSGGTVSFVPTGDDPLAASSNCTTGLKRQLVTLQLTSPDGRTAPSLSFVKGDV